jgi:hypothetical protein
MCEAHAAGDTVDQIVTIFEAALHAALDARAHGGASVHGVSSPDELGIKGAAAHPTAG